MILGVVLGPGRCDPWSGKIPQAVEQLNLWTTAAEPVLKSMLCDKRSHRNEKPAHRN